MPEPKHPETVAAYERHGGNISAVSRELGISRASVRRHVLKAGKMKKPLVGGSIKGTLTASRPLPARGEVTRYILTSAQNNTKVHQRVWENLLALREHYKAELLVGTFSYNKNAYGELAVKRGTKGAYQDHLWYDSQLSSYLQDARIELAPGLVWCGEMNIQPTAVDPLEGLETYSGRDCGIFPHAKHAMRSIATMMGHGAKINYTTGTVTQRNYIQKKAGLVAEHHHSYGGLVVEVDSDGVWFVRQLDADDKGRIYDLDLCVADGKVTSGHRVEAINWGDIHAPTIDVTNCMMPALRKRDGMLDFLRPSKQFMHDIMEGVWTNHHGAKDPHERFKAHLRGLATVADERDMVAGVLKAYARPWAEMIVVDSNHDGQWLYRWLKEHDYRQDPHNAVFFLELQLAVYKALEAENADFNIIETVMRTADIPKIRFLKTDESYTICNGRIECGMHGHLGPDGARGSSANLAKQGRRANIGHLHSAGIFNGLYVAGTSTTLSMGYNKGPSSWSHSHVVTYANGKRAIITMYAGKWRA